MKMTFVSICSFLVAGSLPAAEFSDIAVRQLWPFSRHVEVTFAASDVTGFQRLTLTVKEGNKALGVVPVAAYRGTSGVVAANGRFRLEFDPSAVPALVSRGALSHLTVEISSATLPDEDALYQIFDLAKRPGMPGQREVVTTEALRAGIWGSWEERIWTNPNVTPTGKPVWTGVTNDTKYALNCLVMRRIPAGTFPMGYASSADVGKDAPNISQREVTLTKPYYIGVYPVTKRQLRIVSGSDNPADLLHPTIRDSFDQVRGAYTTAGGPYDWPTDRRVDPQSYVGLFRKATGADFDLPTEAQWEKAARAGSSGVYYDGSTETHKAERMAIAWCYDNSDDQTHPVGRLKANNYGLYDTLGNVWEWVLDWQAGAVDVEATDPEGPTAAGANYWDGSVPMRMRRGGAYDLPYTHIALHHRSQDPVSLNEAHTGWRLAMPAPDMSPEEVVAGVGSEVDVTTGWQWLTAGGHSCVVQWTWPGETESAKLTVTGRKTIYTEVFTPETSSFNLALTHPTSVRGERVLDLTLEFFTNADASGAAVKTQVVKGLGVLVSEPPLVVSDAEFTSIVGTKQVMPILEGMQSLSVDGVGQMTGTGPCWFDWFDTAGLHELRANGGAAASVRLLSRGLNLIIR